jgi:predicted DNA binding CopG/RHH family protein
MAKVNTYVRQKKMGRPITVEADKAIGIRLPVRLLDSVDEAAEGQGVNRSEMIRRLLDQALAAVPKRGRGGAAK